MAFPQTRLRRLRLTDGLRRMTRSTRLHPDDLILPIFVHDNDPGSTEDISSMPGVKRWGLDRLPEILQEAQEAGLSSVILFGLPNDRSEQGQSAMNPDGIFARAIAKAKATVPDMVVISDVCFCGFTDHGHCGLVDGE